MVVGNVKEVCWLAFLEVEVETLCRPPVLFFLCMLKLMILYCIMAHNWRGDLTITVVDSAPSHLVEHRLPSVLE